MRFRLQSAWTSNTGYGKLACGIAKNLLRRKDVDVEIAPHHTLVSDSTPPEIVEALKRNKQERSLGLLIAYPSEAHCLPTMHRMLYTMWETTRLPEVAILGATNASRILVPSTFCASLFSSKVHTMVENIGCGIEVEDYNYDDKRDRDFLTIGILGVMSPRKGIDLLVKAWANTLAKYDDARLIIKTRDTRWLPEQLPNVKGVTLYNELWDTERICDYYHSLDYLMFPTRGEGFGVPPIEAACCGTPGFATAWSGPMDYIGHYIKPISITGLCNVTPGVMGPYNAGQWAQPSYDHLVAILEDVYNKGGPDEQTRRATSTWARGNYDVASVADRIVAIMRRYSK